MCFHKCPSPTFHQRSSTNISVRIRATSIACHFFSPVVHKFFREFSSSDMSQKDFFEVPRGSARVWTRALKREKKTAGHSGPCEFSRNTPIAASGLLGSARNTAPATYFARRQGTPTCWVKQWFPMERTLSEREVQ